MAHLQYIPGDPRLVDQLVYELKSKGIFDQFRKECIADVDTRPAYQNLRQRVESSVSTFLSRQCWRPDLNKNQLREKLRKHILDGNYLEQGVERIVDQVVNPKVASVFIPQVEDLVYNYLGITRKKAPGPETSDRKPDDLLPTDLEAVSPGSVKSNDDKYETMDTDNKQENMDVVDEQTETKDEKIIMDIEKEEIQNIQMPEATVASNDSGSMDKSRIPLPAEEINLENIPAPINSPPKVEKVELDTIALPHEPNLSTDIPLPDEAPLEERDSYFKPIQLHSDDSSSSSASSLLRNMSPLTPIRNFNNENSCDAQQGFDDDSDAKGDDKAAPSSFRFTIEAKDALTDNNSDIKTDKKEIEQADLSHQFNNQVNINTYNTPMYDDSSNSNNLHIDYESDVNSKPNTEIKPEIEISQDSKRDKKSDDKKSSHKISHRSRDSNRQSSSKDKRSDSKPSTARESSRHDKKSSSTKDDKYKSNKEREKSKDGGERKDSRDSSKHRSSHKSSNNKDKDLKSHRSSSSSHRHSSKSTDDKKSSSSKDKEKTAENSKDKSSKDKSKDSKSSLHRSDKDRKSGSSSSKKSDEKDKKKDKKDIDDHYSSSGRGNHSRRSTDRDSNDGSSSSKGSHNQNGSKASETKKESKSSSSKSDNTSTSGDSPSPSDKEHVIVQDSSKISQSKPIVRVDNHLETPIAAPPRLPFVPDVTLKKPRFAANLQEAKKLMKMRKFLDEEQKRMNQEAALLLEFQANVRPSLSQVYSSIPGPELEFACVSNVPGQASVPYEVVNAEAEAVVNENEESIKKTPDMEVAITSETINISEVANIYKPVKVSETESIRSPDVEENTLDEIDETNETIVEKEEDNDSNTKEEPNVKSQNPESPEESDENSDKTYDDNKPFSELMDEITEYSKASEIRIKTDVDDPKSETEDSKEKDSIEATLENMMHPGSKVAEEHKGSTEHLETKVTTENIVENKYFEVTIITEELSESEDPGVEPKEETKEIPETKIPNLPENELHYFAEHEKYKAEIERQEFSSFLQTYIKNVSIIKKMYLINCDTYEENIVREMAATFGDFEVINYYKNGHLKLPHTSKNIVKDVTLTTEITLPLESPDYINKSPLFSPVKSDCSFELSNDYDTKLDDITKKSRQEVLEIILGNMVDSSPSKMPKIDYYTECAIETEVENESKTVESETKTAIDSTAVEKEAEKSLKRRIDKVEGSVNNNRSVLTPHKIRKLSDSDQISSTTEESEEVSNNNKVSNGTRSKYLGRARRVGLPRPKRCTLNSPSSDKSVENYVQNTPAAATPNGKIKTTPRTKVQRYDTSDLYKPKLHYLSRRNNIFPRQKRHLKETN